MKLFPFLLTLFRIKSKPRCINGIRNDRYISLFHCFFSKHCFPCKLRAGKAAVTFFFQIPAQELRKLSFDPFIHTGISRMCNREDTLFVCNRQINGCRTRHMSVHNPDLRMFPDKLFPCLAIGKIIPKTKRRNVINLSS